MTATLTYSGEQTADVPTIQSLIKQGVQIHNQNTPVSVDSASLRLTHDGQIRLIVSISATGNMETLADIQSQVAKAAVDLGFEPDTETAQEAIRL